MSLSPLFSSPQHLQALSLKSLVATNPSIDLDTGNHIVYRSLQVSSGSSPEVAIISGGPSSYGLSLASLVGQGLLYAAIVPPPNFSSPTVDQIYRALRHCVDAFQGVLIAIPNHSENVTNFRTALERVRKGRAEVNVEMLVVGDIVAPSPEVDDVFDIGAASLTEAREAEHDREGMMSGLALVHKITGALVARNTALSDVYKVGRLVAKNVISASASYEDVDSSSGGRRPEQYVGSQDGGGQVQPTQPPSFENFIEILLSSLLPSDQSSRPFRFNTNEPVLLINSYRLSSLDLGAILSLALHVLQKKYQIFPVRVYKCSFASPGPRFPTPVFSPGSGSTFSITLLNVVNTDIGGPGMVELLDQHCEAVGWTAVVNKETWERGREVLRNMFEDEEQFVQQSETGEEQYKEKEDSLGSHDKVEESIGNVKKEQDEDKGGEEVDNDDDSFEIV